MKEVLFIHGVENGTDDEIGDYSYKLRNKTLELTDSFSYTNAKYATKIQQESGLTLELLKKGTDILTTPLPFHEVIGAEINSVLDKVFDVFVYLTPASVNIQNRVREFMKGKSNLVVVAHSLGSVVAFDILKKDIQDGLYANKETRPFSKLITIGSPLNLVMFSGMSNRTDRIEAKMEDTLEWIAVADTNDPVVTGNFFGFSNYPRIDETYDKVHPNLLVKDRYIQTGIHLKSHSAYWESRYVAEKIVDAIKEEIQ